MIRADKFGELPQPQPQIVGNDNATVQKAFLFMKPVVEDYANGKTKSVAEMKEIFKKKMQAAKVYRVACPHPRQQPRKPSDLEDTQDYQPKVKVIDNKVKPKKPAKEIIGDKAKLPKKTAKQPDEEEDEDKEIEEPPTQQRPAAPKQPQVKVAKPKSVVNVDTPVRMPKPFTVDRSVLSMDIEELEREMMSPDVS